VLVDHLDPEAFLDERQGIAWLLVAFRNRDPGGVGPGDLARRRSSLLSFTQTSPSGFASGTPESDREREDVGRSRPGVVVEATTFRANAFP